jgi:uncharacterized protein YkwD
VANGYSAFVGDGNYHDMRNGWWYTYSASTDTAQWNDSGKLRFSYQYGVGQWWQNSSFGGWYKLGDASTINSFVGDGQPHDLWNAVAATFTYKDNAGTHYWSSSGVNYSYSYNYGNGAWSSSYDGSSWVGSGGQTPDVDIQIYNDMKNKVLTNVNSYRHNAGLSNLTLLKEIDYIAQHHTDDMYNTGKFEHDSSLFPTGWQTFSGRFGQIGWSSGKIAENMSSVGSWGIGYSWLQKAKTAVDLWYNEGPENGDGKEHGHYVNMMNTLFNYAGLGVTRNGYVTMDYAQSLNGWHTY